MPSFSNSFWPQRGLGDDGLDNRSCRQADAHDLTLRARRPDRRGGKSRNPSPSTPRREGFG